MMGDWSFRNFRNFRSAFCWHRGLYKGAVKNNNQFYII